jgi:hypothetical protein
MQASPPTEDED